MLGIWIRAGKSMILYLVSWGIEFLTVVLGLLTTGELVPAEVRLAHLSAVFQP